MPVKVGGGPFHVPREKDSCVIQLPVLLLPFLNLDRSSLFIQSCMHPGTYRRLHNLALNVLGGWPTFDRGRGR